MFHLPSTLCSTLYANVEVILVLCIVVWLHDVWARVLFGLASVFVAFRKNVQFIRLFFWCCFFLLAYKMQLLTIYSTNKLCRRCFTTLVLFISFISIIIALLLFFMCSLSCYRPHSVLHIRLSCSAVQRRVRDKLQWGFIPLTFSPLYIPFTLRVYFQPFFFAQVFWYVSSVRFFCCCCCCVFRCAQ